MTARSFRLVFGLVLKLFALETDYSRVVSLLREPKTLSCARVWLKKKTECYALCFSQKMLFTVSLKHVTISSFPLQMPAQIDRNAPEHVSLGRRAT